MELHGYGRSARDPPLIFLAPFPHVAVVGVIGGVHVVVGTVQAVVMLNGYPGEVFLVALEAVLQSKLWNRKRR